MADTIFINYRREDSTGAAGRLHDRLAQAFGRKNLFMDVDHIPPGVDFVEHLNSQVAACDIILVVIGPRWLDAKDEGGQRQLHDPDDFVAIEIAAALTRNIRVIPVLVDGARMPKASELPESLQQLVRRQAVEVRHSQFGRDAEALIKKIQPSLTWRPWMLLAAAPVGALVIYGSIILYELGMPAWTSAPLGVPQDASAQREEERKAKAASEAEAKRKAEQAEQQRLAALKAEGDRKQTEAAVRERYSNVVDQGLAARDSGDHDNAIVKFSEAIRLDPQNPSAFHSRGVAYWNKGDYDRAIVDYNEAIRIDPKNADIFYNRGIAYMTKGDIAEARKLDASICG